MYQSKCGCLVLRDYVGVFRNWKLLMPEDILQEGIKEDICTMEIPDSSRTPLNRLIALAVSG
jgi:hypothetical protein